MFNRDDIFHHTSLDTPDKVDPTELRRVCFIALGASYYLSSASDEEAKTMAHLIARNGLSRLAEDYYDSLLPMETGLDPAKALEAYEQVMNVIQHSSKREMDSVLSTLVFADNVAVKNEIQNSVENIKIMSASFQKDAEIRYTQICKKAGMKVMKMSLTDEEKKLSQIVPVRDEHFICPLNNDYVVAKLGEGAFAGIDLGRYGTYEALNFVDGKRSVLDIAKAVSAEYGLVEPNKVFAFFQVLEKAELVTLNKR
jgi:hypothetical protein